MSNRILWIVGLVVAVVLVICGANAAQTLRKLATAPSVWEEREREIEPKQVNYPQSIPNGPTKPARPDPPRKPNSGRQ